MVSDVSGWTPAVLSCSNVKRCKQLWAIFQCKVCSAIAHLLLLQHLVEHTLLFFYFTPGSPFTVAVSALLVWLLNIYLHQRLGFDELFWLR